MSPNASDGQSWAGGGPAPSPQAGGPTPTPGDALPTPGGNPLPPPPPPGGGSWSTGGMPSYPAPTAVTGQRPASFGQRLVALVIDSIIVGVLTLPLMWSAITDQVNGSASSYLGDASSGQFWGYLVVSTLVTAFCIGRNWSPGMRSMGIGVVDQSTGQPIGFGRALVRGIVSIASGRVLLLGYLWMLWDPKKQTWHDKVARSVVVQQR